jgi:hypothetical protein
MPNFLLTSKRKTKKNTHTHTQSEEEEENNNDNKKRKKKHSNTRQTGERESERASTTRAWKETQIPSNPACPNC